MHRTLRLRASFITLVVTLGLLFVVLALSATPASAHTSTAYWHHDGRGSTHTDWMAPLPDQMPISQISIPGTHDTGSYKLGGDAVETQTMNVTEQLMTGIRAWDIRLGTTEGLGCTQAGSSLWIHHGVVCQGILFDFILGEVDTFLKDHPGETILMRIKKETGTPSDFVARVQINFDKYPGLIYTGDSNNPTLGDVRGKVVVLQDFADEAKDWGIKWGDLGGQMQDVWNLSGTKDLGKKWPIVRNHFDASEGGDMHKIHINFLSAAGWFPYFYASGHLSPATGAGRQVGWLEGVLGNCSGDTRCLDIFPRVKCTLPPVTCSVLFEGINILAMDHINGLSRRAGIVYADFPGPGLIEAIINMNPWNLPPVPDAGGPYNVPENTPVVFDASGSTDPDGDPLTYRWDWVGDGSWTEWSASPTAEHTWDDDFSGTVKLEVDDTFMISTASVGFTVHNVAPAVVASGDTIDENGTATASGTITDPGQQDTFVVEIDWGEGSPEVFAYPAGSTGFNEQYQYLDDNPTGTPSNIYAIQVTVTDDDGGVGNAGTTVTVNNVDPVVVIDSVKDETGTEVGDGIRLVLTLIEVDLESIFTDVGTQDMHIIVTNWGDGSPTESLLLATHAYEIPGFYEISVQVTDDDTGVNVATRSIEVVDAEEALAKSTDDLLILLEDPGLSPEVKASIQKAIDSLFGNKGGVGANGALGLIEKGNLVAGLKKMMDVISHLEDAEAAGGPDFTNQKSLLVLVAKSVAVGAVEDAAATAVKPRDLAKVASAEALIDEASALLATQAYVDAVHKCQLAVRAVQGLLP